MAPSDVVGSELLTAVHLLSKLVGPYAKGEFPYKYKPTKKFGLVPG